MKASIVCAVAILLLGMASGLLSGSGNNNPWFASLAKPGFMPPGWVFPVAWTIIYILLGLALAQIIQSQSPLRTAAIILFVLQLALNLSWSPIFFALHQPRLALVIMFALDLMVIATVAVFAQISLWPALLLVPYLVWLTLATALNGAIVRLNG